MIRTCFNSATASRPWMTMPLPRGDVTPWRLQFGHGLSTMDDHASAAGPALPLRLQFGHGLSTMDDDRADSRYRAGRTLQFGHGLSTMDDVDEHGFSTRTISGASI